MVCCVNVVSVLHNHLKITLICLSWKKHDSAWITLPGPTGALSRQTEQHARVSF